MKQWRWTLNDDRQVPHLQESGQRTDLRDAMIDVANTVEHLLLTQNQKQWTPNPSPNN